MPEPKEEGGENLDDLLSQKNNRTERKNSCKHLKLRVLRGTNFQKEWFRGNFGKCGNLLKRERFSPLRQGSMVKKW